VDSNGAIALASAVESAASKYNDLPVSVTDAVAQIIADRIVLQQAVAKTPGGIVTVKEADRRVDKVGGAFHDICAAWASLAEFLPQGQDAQVLMDRVFSDGRRFVNLKVKEEWAAIETKLSTIDREGLATRIDAIGAAPVFGLLAQMHAVYGAVIGTTAAPEEAPEVRDSKDALLDSLRAYVIQVAGTVKRGKPETAMRADALLRPVREWEGTKPAKDKAGNEEAPAGAASGPATSEG